MARTAVILFALLISLPSVALSADKAPGKSFRGKFTTKQPVVLKDRNGKKLDVGTAEVSAFTSSEKGVQFDFKAGWLKIEMPKRDRKGWSQVFIVTSDVTRDGKRVVEYKRPAPGTEAAEKNMRGLNGNRLIQFFAKYKELVGGGSIEFSGNNVHWENSGTTKGRVLWFNQSGSYNETFDGVAEGL